MKVKIVIGLLLLALLAVYLHAVGREQRRAKFIAMMSGLDEAQNDLRHFGGFTNYPNRFSRVYSYTNQYSIGGTNYQCELAAENEEFSEMGTLAITTNQLYLWVDRARGTVVLIRGHTKVSLPSGL